jgi:D-alanyl-lipoteichoic acid acyltransferase DltB (MBOAT superfamily)
LYIPIGGSQGKMMYKIRNIFIIFIVSGFWHGANWTFIAWGFLNALYFIPLMVRNKNRQFLGTVASGKLVPNMNDLLRMITTFSLTTFAFIFFRSDSVREAMYYIRGLLVRPGVSIPDELTITAVITICAMLIIEWIQREKSHGLEISRFPRALRWSIYMPIAFIISIMAGEHVSFIYFQF